MGGSIDIVQRGWHEVIHDHDHDHLVAKVRCLDLLGSDRDDLSCRRAVDSSSYVIPSNELYFILVAIFDSDAILE